MSILLTGYRSPGDAEAECSGRAAQKLNGASVNGFKVETKLLPLSYDAVDQFIDSIPENHDYEFFLHVGVHMKIENVRLEQIACCGGYKRPDMHNKLPRDSAFHIEPPVCAENLSMCTGFDMDLCKTQLNAIGVPVDTSNEAGRYLCEYMYYRSLCKNGGKVLFVHVPPEDVVPMEETCRILKEIIKICLQQIYPYYG